MIKIAQAISFVILLLVACSCSKNYTTEQKAYISGIEKERKVKNISFKNDEDSLDVTGSESGVELTMMQLAVDAFRRAAEVLAGRAPLGVPAAELCRHVVPPRAADETPRQYTERVNRMTERFRSLMESSGREPPR